MIQMVLLDRMDRIDYEHKAVFSVFSIISITIFWPGTGNDMMTDKAASRSGGNMVRAVSYFLSFFKKFGEILYAHLCRTSIIGHARVPAG